MRAAAVQLNAKADKAANLEKADRLVRRAAADGAQLVVLPEKWTAFGTGDDFRAAAEPIGGEASTWASNAARDEAVLTETAGGVEIGLTVCYDLRFPELFRVLAVDGARILTVPAAFTVPTTRDHWEPLVRARAIENQAFVIAAYPIGEHPPTHRSGGRSLIVDPWGIVLAAAPDTETVITADLDLEGQAAIRRRLPSLANRRPAAYRRAAAATPA